MDRVGQALGWSAPVGASLPNTPAWASLRERKLPRRILRRRRRTPPGLFYLPGMALGRLWGGWGELWDGFWEALGRLWGGF